MDREEEKSSSIMEIHHKNNKSNGLRDDEWEAIDWQHEKSQIM